MLTSDCLDAASSFRRTVILALFVAFLFTVIEAAGEEKLTLEANPDQPLTRENNTGDNVTLTCKGMIHPSSTFLSFSVLHTLDEEVTTYVSKVFPTGSMPTANVSAELVGCYAGDYVLCQGISSKFSYNENGSLAIVVVIKSFLCRLRGLWKCKVIFRYAGRLEDITMKAHLTFHGFSWPSNLTLTFGESHKEMNKVAVIAGSQVLLTCRGNVGSTAARLIFVSYHHNGTEHNEEWFSASKESDYKQSQCQWIHEATFNLTVQNNDDLKILKCNVKDNHHNIILSSSPTALYVVNGPGTTWRTMSKSKEKMEIISDPALKLTESSVDVKEASCFDNVWLVFGVVAVSVVVIVIILESANAVYRKVKKAMEKE